ncbi:translin-associated factor-X domain-containing protein [Phanerochaete sordida]|uniref:Translin-associated factor-X domain-containing protein n=1 Tax=Phanerochaete sordida TaxID=48140 RepID=A0A9P3G3U1_9APHY|nr:translin-associated factor-X domain-containing protein [Phanerochaete sordida]
MSDTTNTNLGSRDAILSVFEGFRDELDDHNDRRERLIKHSRDVTNLSKKIIFLLHRIMTDDASEGSGDGGGVGVGGGGVGDRSRALKAASKGREKLREVQGMFANVRHELTGDRFWRYQRQVSPGLQEYIEALSFAHYLETGKLIGYEEVQKSLSDDQGAPYFPLPLEDYLLGLSDLTGELMRYAISAISRRGGRTKAQDVCVFVRNCRADFEVWTPYFKDLRKKQNVTSQSLEKIEDAAYAIMVRSSEYDLSPDMLDDIVARTVSFEHGNGSGRKRGRDYEGEDGPDE